MKYDVFISYSRKDLVVADKICDVLDKAGVSYFIDRQGIGGGMEFPKVIATAIKESELFLFLASENSYSSKFTTSEITFAFNKKQKNQLLPYVIDSSSLPDELEFVFSCINIRNIKEHPIETTLVEDILDLLGRKKVHDPLCPCGSGKLFKDCHGKKEPDIQPTVTPTPVTVDRIWRVGDYYNVNGKEGVVFWVDGTKKHGKIVSMREVSRQWCDKSEFSKRIATGAVNRSNGAYNHDLICRTYGGFGSYPAVEWCRDLGEGWYLPAIEELKELMLKDSVYSPVNASLVQNAGDRLSEKRSKNLYWSSTEAEILIYALLFNMEDGKVVDYYKHEEHRVRAVSAF